MAALPLFSQGQDFESQFLIQSYPEEFLPGWYANELRESNSRVFQYPGFGIGGSNAIAMQPISSFDGELIVKLEPSQYESPSLVFWARSMKNGSGDRAAVVEFSWADKIDGDYSEKRLLGNEDEFGNVDQEFRKFELELPEETKNLDLLFLKITVSYGAGSGTCARWMMDDFEFGDQVKDLTPPSITRVRGYEEHVVEIQFSERLDPVFSQFLLNYRLDEEVPEEVSVLNDSLVYLSFPKPLSFKEFQLKVNQIPDLEGNFLSDTTLVFEFSDPTNIPYKNLIINELMPAPKPDMDFPNVEFVELFNAGDHKIRLEGVSLSTSKTEVQLPEYWMEPGAYLILFPQNKLEEMKDYAPFLALNFWPTLLNSGERIILQNDRGELVDQLEYSSSSWGSNELATGGYSLEVVNPFLSCEQTGFLKASIDPLRASPGRENSVLDLSPDTISPVLVHAAFLDSLQILLRFSEPIVQLDSLDSIHFTPQLKVETVKQVESNAILIELLEPAKPSQKYQLSIGQFAMDCAGNLLESSGSTQLILPEEAQMGDIKINELLFNPKSGRPKFVELYNDSDKYLEVGALKLGNLDDTNMPGQLKFIAESGLILGPHEYFAVTTDALKLKSDFPQSPSSQFYQIASLPSYPISGGAVVLLSDKDEIYEVFVYDEDLHHPLLRDPKGVSLERVSTDSPSDLDYNWHSAASNEDFGTPGKRNSNTREESLELDMILISPEVFDPEGSNGNTFTTISYQLDQSGWMGTFEIYDIAGRLVTMLDNNGLLGLKGMYTWTGTNDSGQKVRPGYYILRVKLFDLQGEVIELKKTIVVGTHF
ncbi:hypothetical protein ALPR1_03525 [Algoriphagus machipongonensis]|uniref:LTD domain-containing protein n=2 Tax=Algoriphagus machipongonensis TaxID=388413 RepID=A3HVV8_9BACT|nr:hypothetical protein ALPR1_03525 [Algoriphagus machipongonensis]